MESLVDHRKNDKAMSVEDKRSVLSGWPVMRKSNSGCQICVQWKDGSTSWKSLKNLNELNHVQTAEYAVAQGIDHEPGFNWWVGAVLKKRERII